MGIFGRAMVVFAAFFSLATVAYVYSAIEPWLIEPAKEGGMFAGPFSDVAVWMQALVPTLIAVLLLGYLTWMVVGGAQEERNVRRVRR